MYIEKIDELAQKLLNEKGNKQRSVEVYVEHSRAVNYERAISDIVSWDYKGQERKKLYNDPLLISNMLFVYHA